MKLPYIAPLNGIDTLFVDERPFTMYGGEIHNSSSSSLQYMDEKVWPYLRDLHMNTVIAPIYWETVEPRPGEFDHSLMEGLVARAREEGVRLVLLWFGLWKNGQSDYAPGWVLANTKRFFRAHLTPGNPSATISTLCEAAVNADANAFARVMRRLKEIDGEAQTVIMVQVQNEVGMLRVPRDLCPDAERAFFKEVPAEVAAHFGAQGTWRDAFREDASECFMAYCYAKALEKITAAGRAEYPLPMFVNAWLEQFPKRPGVHPSGGPTGKMMPMWKKFAPSVALLAPDIYHPDFDGFCREYAVPGNPLLIPEARRDVLTASYVFWAVGQYHALCYAPFGIEDFLNPGAQEEMPEAEGWMEYSVNGKPVSLRKTGPYLARSYELLRSLQELILAHRGTSSMQAFLKACNHEQGTFLSFSTCDLEVRYAEMIPGKPVTAGIVIEIEPGTLLLAGTSATFIVWPKKESDTRTAVISYEEGKMANGQWRRSRILNGDERYRGICLSEYPDVKLIRVYSF